MSTKCTVLFADNFHFYFDYKDGCYHLDVKDVVGQRDFFNKAGQILESCPYSDSGLYMMSLKKGVKDKVIKPKCCCKSSETNIDGINSPKDVKVLNLKKLEELETDAHNLKEMYEEKFDMIHKEIFMRSKR